MLSDDLLHFDSNICENDFLYVEKRGYVKIGTHGMRDKLCVLTYMEKIGWSIKPNDQIKACSLNTAATRGFTFHVKNLSNFPNEKQNVIFFSELDE